MRILISGSSGLIGSALSEYFQKKGHKVVLLVRQPRQGGIYWNPQSEGTDPEDFEGFDVVIHLAGKNLASGRWTRQLKEEIFQSRYRTTQFLSHILTKLHHPPHTLIVASAVGYYGNCGEEILTETSKAGKGFLAEVCQKWEGAALSAKNSGIRVIHARFGMVLSNKRGALKKLLFPYRLGLGAILGSGEQYLSWIALEDVVNAMQFLIDHFEIEGPVNVASPFPEKMAHFSQKLAHALHRPLFLRIGETPLKWLMGDMAEGMLLSSIRAVPEKLQSAGFIFSFSRVEDYFTHQGW